MPNPPSIVVNEKKKISPENGSDELPDDENVEYCICDHDIVHKDNAVWIKPSNVENVHSPSQRRPYCKKCGRLKYMGSATAKKMGFYINLLKEIQKKLDAMHRRKATRHRLTSVQIRLIIKDLEKDDFFLDRFSNQRYSQYDFFKMTLQKYCPVPDEIIQSVYQDFKG
jgi:hypothetical protein